MPTLENANLKAIFTDTGVGINALYLKPAYYAKGYAQKTANNNLGVDGSLNLAGSDYHILLFGGVEYNVTDLAWNTTATTVNSRDLYGKFDTFGNIPINVVQAVCIDPVMLNGGRIVTRQEITYFFTLDGKGIVKKVKITLDENPALDNIVESMKVLNFVAVNSVIGSKFDVQTYYYGTDFLGFNYINIAAYNAEWVTDGGLTVTVPKSTLYPNLLPDFNSSEWKNPATVIDAKTIDLIAGANTYLCVFNAYPSRPHYLTFEVQNLSGELQVEFAMARNARNIDTDADLQRVNITENGLQVLVLPLGYDNNWLYVRFNQLTGICRIYEPSVNYRSADVVYVVPGINYLSNHNLRNCIRVQSANPNGLALTKTLPANIKVADGVGLYLGILPLDNTAILDGAFKIGFQKPDNSWVYTGELNLFVDYIDVYGGNIAKKANLWENSMIGVPIPAGVDEIKAVKIQFTTTNTIDWLIGQFTCLRWQSEDVGLVSDNRTGFGLNASGIRSREFSLRGAHGLVYSNNTTIKAERINIDNRKLSFSNATSISAMYELLDIAAYIPYSSIVDRGYELDIDVSGLSNFSHPMLVKNWNTGTEYKIKRVSGSILTIDTENESPSDTDSIQVQYKEKYTYPASYYTLGLGGIFTWGLGVYEFLIGKTLYMNYVVSVRTDNIVGMILGSSNKTNSVRRCLRPDVIESPPLLSNYDIVVFSPVNNSVGEVSFIYYPTKQNVGDSLYSEVQEVQDMLEDLTVLSRQEPLSPTPKNYGLIPHLAFGGEQIAANPIEYLIECRKRFDAAGCNNAIMATGSLSFLYDRDLERWWYWSASLRDLGIDYLHFTRQMLRNNKSESDVSKDIGSHRYFFELTTFSDEHLKYYRNQAAIDYQGEEKYQRVWYYQEPGGLYLAKTHAWEDFQDSYYAPIISNNKTYTFQYHYSLILPAFWSIVTSGSDWGLSENTIYDEIVRRANYLCQNYDTEGIIISELIHYRLSFSANDFILFNNWCVANGHGTQYDWPRFHSNNYADPDNTLVCQWKRWQVKKFLTEISVIVHGYNKLIGVNVLVQNIFAITNTNNPIWTGYEQRYKDEFGSWHVNTLDYNLDRYGTNYEELLASGVVDMFYVWLYHRYSPFGIQTILDFLEKYANYKERMFIGIGLFPFEAPPDHCEIVQLLKIVLSGGWFTTYAGYPPMMIRDEYWQDIWDKIKGYAPRITYNPETAKIIVNPGKAVEVPFNVRF